MWGLYLGCFFWRLDGMSWFWQTCRRYFFCFRRSHSSASDDVELEEDDVELEEDSRSASVCRLFLAPAFCKRAAALATRAVSSFSRMMGSRGLACFCAKWRRTSSLMSPGSGPELSQLRSPAQNPRLQAVPTISPFSSGSATSRSSTLQCCSGSPALSLNTEFTTWSPPWRWVALRQYVLVMRKLGHWKKVRFGGRISPGSNFWMWNLGPCGSELTMSCAPAL